jgi:hypothetical protein
MRMPHHLFSYKQLSIFAAIAALTATASAYYGNATVVYSTQVLTAYTTVVSAATEFTFNGEGYTATEVSTL